MAPCRSMMYIRGLFIHETAWVPVDPQCNAKAHSLPPWVPVDLLCTAEVCTFMKEHGSQWTHNVRQRLFHSLNTVGFSRPTMYLGTKFSAMHSEG